VGLGVGLGVGDAVGDGLGEAVGLGLGCRLGCGVGAGEPSNASQPAPTIAIRRTAAVMIMVGRDRSRSIAPILA
jgi:hypothetical protein